MTNKNLLVCFLLVGCGLPKLSDVIDNGDKPYKVRKTDPSFYEYIERFERDFNLTVKVPVVFKALEDKYAGVCLKWQDGYREININTTYWNQYTEYQKEQLIYHELGHCVVDLKHDDDVLNGCPKSIMRSFMFSTFEIDRCYDPFRTDYIVEMYNKIF